MALNKAFLGKVYQPEAPWAVKEDATKAYALATNSQNPAYLGPNPVAPPMYGVVYGFPMLMAPLFDGELGANVMRLVHGEQDMRFLAPVKPGDVVTTTATIASIQDKVSGELLEVALNTTNQDGVLVGQATAGLFIKGRVRRDKNAPAPAPDEPQETPAPSGAPVLETTVVVGADQSLRYADASGDHNPIHKDSEMAKAAGLPDIILHGICSMAFVHNALVDKLGGGRPESVKRLKVRFAKPVMNGDVLTIKAWERSNEAGVRTLAVEVTNPAGVVVVKDGIAELSA